MGADWTRETVIKLSPDDSSLKAAEKLANKSKWQNTGHDDISVWGECQGSGANPYQVRIDLREPAFKCSCPSRKFPCKHGLGLFLIFVSGSNAISSAESPAWVSEWISSRDAKQQKKEEKKQEAEAKPVDPEAQMKRLADKQKKASEGFDEVMLRLHDVVRNGLIQAKSYPYKFWDDAAKRLIDSQMPGLAVNIRNLAEICGLGKVWHIKLLEKLGRLQLLAEAYKSFADLPKEKQDDISAALGWTVSKEAVLQQPGIKDFWIVAGVAEKEDNEARLKICKTWLIGRQTGQYALILDFYPLNQPVVTLYIPNTEFEGELVFYPGTIKHRALIKEKGTNRNASFPIPAFPDFDSAFDAFSKDISANPWIEEYPFNLENVIPFIKNNEWFLKDKNSRIIPAMKDEKICWQQFARSGGQPINIFGEWNGSSFKIYPASDIFADKINNSGYSVLLLAIANKLIAGLPDEGIKPPISEGQIGKLLSEIQADTQEKQALIITGVLSLYEKSGFMPEEDKSKLAVCEEENIPLCRKEYSYLLTQLLNEHHPELFPESLRLLAQHKQIADCSLIPEILNSGIKNKSLHRDIAGAIGNRGRWLSAFNENWKYIGHTYLHDDNAKEYPLSMWEEGSLDDRVEYLKSLRRNTPGKVIEIFEKSFSNEPAKNRLAFIETLRVNLSTSDEQFLEAALKDKSIGVKQEAARLLSTIPGSAFAQRIIEQVKRFISLKKGLLKDSIIITLPEEFEEFFKINGFSEKKPQDVSFGEKAWWLSQIIEYTPVSFWSDYLGKKPVDILKIISKDEWFTSIYRGLSESVKNSGDEEWIIAFFEFHKEKSQMNEQFFYLNMLPPEKREFHLTAIIDSIYKDKDNSISHILNNMKTENDYFPETLSSSILKFLKRHIKGDQWVDYWEFRDKLKYIAVHISPGLLEEAQTGWADDSKSWAYLTAKDENFYQVLKFRYNIHKEIER